MATVAPDQCSVSNAWQFAGWDRGTMRRAALGRHRFGIIGSDVKDVGRLPIMIVSSSWRLIAAYAAGVWGGLMIWAALAQYVLPGRGHALGKLGSFDWVFLINVFPAVLCAVGFAVGLACGRWHAYSRSLIWRAPLILGLVFPLSMRLLRPVLDQFGAGMIPALVWCVLGSACVALLLARWERRTDRAERTIGDLRGPG